MKEVNDQPTETREKSVWNSVMPFSKYAALLLFITMPFIGGWVGYHYAPVKVVEVERIVIKEVAQENVADLSEPIKETKEVEVAAEINFNITSSGSFELPEDLIVANPSDCLPTAPVQEPSSKLYVYVTEELIEEMKQLVPGARYGSFVYEGYVCEPPPIEPWPGEFVPKLYFSGIEEIEGHDFWAEMAGGSNFEVHASEEGKLPELITMTDERRTKFDYVSSYRSTRGGKNPAPIIEIENCGCGYGATSTLLIDGLVYGLNESSPSFYGQVHPSVRSVHINE